VAGTADGVNTWDIALARVTADGTLDTSFDGDGLVTTSFSSTAEFGESVAIQPDGKILVFGSADVGANDDVAIARYLPNGALDTSFSGDGKLTLSYGSGNSSALHGVLQPDWKIVVAGESGIGAGVNFAAARLEGNTPPTNPASVLLTAMNEDAPAESNLGVLAASIVATSGATDLDSQALGIAVTAADNANGQWEYSTDGGGAWQAVSSVTTTSARLLAPAHRVRFVPNADFNSTIGPSPTISVKVWDQTSGTAGLTADTTVGSAFSGAAAMVTLPVTAVNDAPSFMLADTMVVRSEDVGAVMVSDFAIGIARGPATATDEAGQTLAFQVMVTGTTGGLAFASAPSISAATAALMFTPAANTHGTATVQVVLQDNGSSTPPNVNASAALMFTIDVAPVNDEQVVATNTGLMLAEGGTATITTARLQTTDIDDAASELMYTVTGGPYHGVLRVNGVPASEFTQ
jgi:uncharacterized delta-60 repeat protein